MVGMAGMKVSLLPLLLELLGGVTMAMAMEDKVYWSNNFQNNIQRANLADGSDIEEVVDASEASFPWGLVIDPEGCTMFWADFRTHAIKSRQLNGAGGTHTLLELDEAPYGLFLTEEDHMLYWTQQNGKVRRVSLNNVSEDGSVMHGDPEDLITSYSGSYFPRLGIAVDTVEQPPRVLIAETEEWVISRQRWGTANEDEWWIEEWESIWSPEGLAIDTEAREIYWVDSGYKSVRKASLETGDSSVEVVLGGLSGPRDLALDIVAQKIYIADRATSGGNSSIIQASFSGDIGWRISLPTMAQPSGIAILKVDQAVHCFSTSAAETTDAPATTETTTGTLFV